MLALRRRTAAILLCSFLFAAPATGFVWPTRVEQWQEQLARGDVAQRRECMRRVRDYFDVSLRPLVERALQDSDAMVRRGAAEIVATYRLNLAGRVIPWLDGEDADGKLAAIRVLTRVPDVSGTVGLVRASKHREPAIRLAAVLALAQYPGDGALEALLAALNDDEPKVKRASIEALANRGDSGIASALLVHVTDSDESVRAKSTLALAVIGLSNAFGAAKLGLTDGHPAVRASAARAIGLMGTTAGADEAALLLSLVTDEQPVFVVSTAVDVLLAMDGERIRKQLIEKCIVLLREQHRIAVGRLMRESSQSSAIIRDCFEVASLDRRASCLEWVGEETADLSPVVTAARRGSLDPLAALRALARGGADPGGLAFVLSKLESDAPSLREAALAALERILRLRGSGQALDPLVKILGSTVPLQERARMVRLIGMTRSPRASDTIATILSTHNGPSEELLAAIDAARYLGRSVVTAQLVALLEEPNGEVAAAAARSLYELRDPASLTGLLECLSLGAPNRESTLLALSGALAEAAEPRALDRALALLETLDGSERDAWIEGIARNGFPKAREAKLMLARQGSPADRGKLAEGLGDGAAERSLLSQLSRDPSGAVRAAAVWSLGRSGTDFEWKTVETCCRDERVDVRANAAVALGRMAARKTRDVRTALCPLLQDSTAGVRHAALVGLALASQHCGLATESALLLQDGDVRVREAAARLLASVPGDPGEQRSDQSLRWCRAFDPVESVRRACGSGRRAMEGSEPTQGRGTLVFVELPGKTRVDGARIAMGLLRPDGLIRYTRADRRGAIFEPDCDSEGVRLVRPIALDR